MEPSKQIVSAADETSTVRDSLGRDLSVRAPNALDRLRLFKALGPSLSENLSYVGMALLAYVVSAVDGVPVPLPGSEANIEALIQRLGDAGLSAVANWLEQSDGASVVDAGN